MKKRIFLSLAIVPVVFGAFKAADRVTFRRDAWLADYAQLKREVEHNYANLKWAAPAKGVTFVALNDSTVARLDRARTQSQARAALAEFIAAFKDGHFHIESGPPKPIAALMNLWPKGGEPKLDFALDASEACSALGYRQKAHALDFEHARLARDNQRTFAAGVLTLEDGRKFGIIRIPLFQQREYGAACERAWQSFRAGRVGPCDDACHDEFSHLAKYEVAAQLAHDARMLARVAGDGLVIDLTGNGGGTEWAEYAAFALTPMPLRPPAVAAVRGEHWARAFAADAGELEEPDRATALAMRDSARAQCDLAPIWRDAAFKPNCWNIVPVREYASRDYAASLRQDRPYTGKLYIMADQHTASASEQFIAMLKDARAATVIGTRTLGVGCGYTNGGIDIKLRNSGLAIRMPDCARLRRDGSNEYEGIEPDIAADWKSADKGVVIERALAGS